MTRKSKIQSVLKVAGLPLIALLACAGRNTAVSAAAPPIPVPIQAQASAPETSSATPRPATNYILGPDDEITILAPFADELSNKPLRISKTGDLNVPKIGNIHASGMTIKDLEGEVILRLKKTIREPNVVINVSSFRSQPVTVIGYVGAPGEVQLEGHKTLYQILTKAGGLRPDAGSRIKITRKIEMGPIPLPSATTNGSFSIAEVSATSFERGTNPEENIEMLPYDTIFVARADFVHVIGGVQKPGSYALNDKKSVSLIELLAWAGGPASTAARKNARIIRKGANDNHIDIPVNIADVLNKKSKSQDIKMQADDILYIPDSYTKGALKRTLDQIISGATGIAIYHPY